MGSLAEWLGYIASFFVVISFAVGNKVRLIRSLNFVGCAFFVAYGWMIEQIPVVLTNVVICLVQLYYLFMAPKTPSNSL